MKINILYATVRGNAQRLAQFMHEYLQSEFDHEVALIGEPTLADLNECDAVIFCVSNTGQGQFPPSFVPFYQALEQSAQSLSELKQGIVCLGNSNYETFAQTGRLLEQSLNRLGAKEIYEPLVIDASEDRFPNQRAEIWLQTWLKRLAS